MHKSEVERFCQLCGKKLGHLCQSQIKQGRGKYCSNKCANTGKNHHAWKEKPSYIALHVWVGRKYGNPSHCARCGIEGKRVIRKDGRTRWTIQWANKSGEYRRNIDDFVGLCQKCHFYNDHKDGFVMNQFGKHKIKTTHE